MSDIIGFQQQQLLRADHMGRELPAAAFHQIIKRNIFESVNPAIILIFASYVKCYFGLLVAIMEINGTVYRIADTCFEKAVTEKDDCVVQQLIYSAVIPGQIDENHQIIFIAERAGTRYDFFKMMA